MNPFRDAILRRWRGVVATLTAALLLGLLAVIWTANRTPPEPVWAGHPLSAWLDYRDASWRFDLPDTRHPPFTDAEIDLALDNLAPDALPFLKRWLVERPGKFSTWCNARLSAIGLDGLRLPTGDARSADRAVTGFQCYGAYAQPLLPWLTKLTRSSDAELRTCAYTAVFFTRPEKAVFLALADEALRDPDSRLGEMAACWMVQRFPEEAARRNLGDRFPNFYDDAAAATNAPVPAD